MVRIAIAGAAGRMGRSLATVLAETKEVELTAAFEHPLSTAIGQDVGELAGCGKLGVLIESDLAGKTDQFDLLIDFTLPDPTLVHLEECKKAGKAVVIGATGFSSEQLEQIKVIGQHIPLVHAANYSVGINLMLKLAHDAARVLGEKVDIEVIEAHHRDKIDAPSGTALKLGHVLAKARDWDFEESATFAREGVTGVRKHKSIGFSTVRGGDVVGEHTVLYIGLGERLEITHRATNRLILARGAVQAALWLQHQSADLYDMHDVLGL